MTTTLLDPTVAIDDDELVTRPEPETDYYEEVDGVGHEWPEMSNHANLIGFDLAAELRAFARSNRLGHAVHEMKFRLPLPVDRRRRPDVAFVPASRWPAAQPIPDGNGWAVLPELCVEVVSPTDQAAAVRDKVEEYFTAGVRVVWVIYPLSQVIDIYESGSAVRTLRRADALDGAPVLPGFTLPLAELFPQPVA